MGLELDRCQELHQEEEKEENDEEKEEEERDSILSQETISYLLTGLRHKFSQAAPQPTSRPSLTGKDPGLGDSLSSLTSSQAVFFILINPPAIRNQLKAYQAPIY